MKLKEIALELKNQAKQWHEISEGQLRLKYKEPRPVDLISKYLHQAYMKHSLPIELQQLCQKLEKKAKGLKEYATFVDDIEGQSNYHTEIKKYNSLLSQFLEDIEDIAITLFKQPQEGEWSIPMSKRDMMNKIKIDGYSKFNSWAKKYDITSVNGNRQLFIIRLDNMDKNTRSLFEK